MHYEFCCPPSYAVPVRNHDSDRVAIVQEWLANVTFFKDETLSFPPQSRINSRSVSGVRGRTNKPDEGWPDAVLVPLNLARQGSMQATKKGFDN